MTPNVHNHVTYERIAELFAAGVTYADIARRLGCSKDTIFFRLRRARRADPEAAQRDLEQRTCKCGRTKRPSFSECCWCRGRKPSAPKYSCNDAGQFLLRLKPTEEHADRPKCETNALCPCGLRVMAATAHACVLCQGTGEELDRLMAAERGISVERLRELMAAEDEQPCSEEVEA